MKIIYNLGLYVCMYVLQVSLCVMKKKDTVKVNLIGGEVY